MTAIVNATIAAAPPSYLVVIIIISLVLHPTGYSAKYVWWLQSASGVRLLPPETVQPNRRRPELTPRVPTRWIRPPYHRPHPRGNEKQIRCARGASTHTINTRVPEPELRTVVVL